MDSCLVLVDSTVNEEKSCYFHYCGRRRWWSGVNSGSINLMLKQPGERTRSQKQIANQFGLKRIKINEATIIVTQQQTIGSGSAAEAFL